MMNLQLDQVAASVHRFALAVEKCIESVQAYSDALAEDIHDMDFSGWKEWLRFGNSVALHHPDCWRLLR